MGKIEISKDEAILIVNSKGSMRRYLPANFSEETLNKKDNIPEPIVFLMAVFELSKDENFYKFVINEFVKIIKNKEKEKEEEKKDGREG